MPIPLHQKNFKLLITIIYATLLASSCHNQSRPNSPSTMETKPIPEFAGVESVVVSSMALNPPYESSSLASAIRKVAIPLIQLENVASPHRFFAPHSDIWIRDLAPQWVQLTAVSKGTSGIEARGMRYLSRGLDDDRAGANIADRVGLPFRDSFLHMDGGNILNDGTDCYSAAEDFGGRWRGPHQKNHLRSLRSHLGCRKLFQIAGAPHGHIDMWAKFVNKDTVLINEITPEHLEFIWNEHGSLYQYTRSVQTALNQIAQQFRAINKTVIRIPMPTPLPLMWRTYTNSLTINQFVLLPRYKESQMPGVSYPDENLLKSLESHVEKIYRDQGLTPLWVDSDSYIRRGGSLHCLAITIPAHDSKNPLVI